MRTSTITTPLALALALGAVLLALPAGAAGEETAPPSTVTSAPAPPPTATTPPPTTTTPAVEPTPTAPSEAPQVQSQLSQGSTPAAPSHRAHGQAGQGAAPANTTTTVPAPGAKTHAPSPSALTPSLPFALRSSLSGIPPFFIESFQVPPFLLPIYQAAGTAYGIPWQVLAAINEVETDYGRDLSVSSAGAEGWMQFLPSSWEQFGVDANGDGFKDPYNPADAIFAAARYLRAAGGDQNLRAAIYSYNHSATYVESVMLRAQLLGGTPAELLGAITGLTEARFPVHAAAHFSDGFPTVGAGADAHTVAGTTIYSSDGAPVIAVQDGEVVQIGDSPMLGRFVSLRDAFGNTYTYAQLGSIASLYPVLQPRVSSAVPSQIAHPGSEPAPTGPATAGVQPRSPLSEGATVSGLALGAAAGLESVPSAPRPQPVVKPAPTVREFREGTNDVFLHPLTAGVQVIAGTVLGHVGSGDGGEPHIVFQVRPAGAGAPLIDPKPVLDGWVALESSSTFHAKGQNPFLATSPTVGQVLLESKQQLQPQVLHDAGIQLGRCGRQAVQSGRVDKRVLAALEYLSVSGLRPTVAGLACSATATLSATNARSTTDAAVVRITAVNGEPLAGHEGPGGVADTTVRKLLMLQGLSRPRRIESPISYPGSAVAVVNRRASGIEVAFAAPTGALARLAGVFASALAPAQWTKLIARLGEIPDPAVAHGHSSAAIPDREGEAGGHR